MSHTEKIVKDEKAQLDFSQSMSYGDYLHLDEVLGAQHPLSPAHDEMLFIIQHQTSELWMKLMLHELHGATRCIAANQLPDAFKMLARVSRIMEQLVSAWTVLSTMTPPEYTAMRPYLASSSGFQSAQYRLMEFLLGGRNPDMVTMHEATPEVAAALRAELDRPSLYDEAVRLLARRGFRIPDAVLERDHRGGWSPSPQVEAAWAAIYREPEDYWDLYELAEKLVDLEYHFQRWRFGHLKTVERIIGFKRGTGGTAGVPYLESVLKKGFFPELLAVRTEI